jgi:hypothetical protein
MITSVLTRIKRKAYQVTKTEGALFVKLEMNGFFPCQLSENKVFFLVKLLYNVIMSDKQKQNEFKNVHNDVELQPNPEYVQHKSVLCVCFNLNKYLSIYLPFTLISIDRVLWSKSKCTGHDLLWQLYRTQRSPETRHWSIAVESDVRKGRGSEHCS